MAFVKCEEIGHGKRRAHYSADFNLALDEPEREWVRVFRVTLDDATDDAYEMLLWAWDSESLPLQWAAFPSDELALAGDFAVEETANPEVWLVTITYKLYPDPTLEPAITRVTTGQTQRAIEEALDPNTGFPVGMTASNRRPFDPPPEGPEGHLILTITKALKVVDEAAIVRDFLFHTNSEPWRDFAPGLVWMADFGSEEAYANGFHFKKTTWTMHVRKRGWILRLLDCGFDELTGYVGGVAQYLPITVRGQPVSAPALLNGAGRKLTDGSNPRFLEFVVYEEADFNSLPLAGV